MVAIQAITESNVRIASSLPAGLVAVFAGATSGIGESTLRQFTKRVQRPRIYFLGRRENEGQRIQAELKALNPGGEYHYVKNDSSLLENVDQACQYIREREPVINLLFLSCGTLITGKRKGPICLCPCLSW
jgi:NADP-dependent 3-hydroxy acid dehydrogenase YdfG